MTSDICIKNISLTALLDVEGILDGNHSHSRRFAPESILATSTHVFSQGLLLEIYVNGKL